MLIKMNIKIVLEIGKSVPNCNIRVSANVRRPTTAIITTIIMPSRFRLLRSSIDKEDTGFLDSFLSIN